VINSGTTGAANTVSISVSNLSGDNGLSSLGVTSTPGVVSAGNPSGGSSITSAGSIAWTQSVAAQDAQFTIGGTAATSASNTVTTVLSGVTLNLSAASVGTTQTLTIATDVTTQVGDIQTFVSDYNSLVSTMASQSSFDANGTPGQQGGPLLGDSMLTTIQSTLGNLVSGSVTSSGVTAELSSIGITLNDDGTLSVDTTTLTTAVQNDSATVGALFNSTNGLAQQMNAQITGFTGTGGIIASRINAIDADFQSITTQSTALTAYEAQLTTQYNAQFTALNTLMASTNNDSQYLTQLFGGANSAGALAGSGK
jgi:flagellar hook-associated protein 2